MLRFNDKKFLSDLKSVRDVMVFAQATRTFLPTKKLDVRNQAKRDKIKYYMTDEIFVSKRMVMVIV